MKYRLDNSSQREVLDQISSLDDSLEDVNIQVMCSIILYKFVSNQNKLMSYNGLIL